MKKNLIFCNIALTIVLSACGGGGGSGSNSMSSNTGNVIEVQSFPASSTLNDVRHMVYSDADKSLYIVSHCNHSIVQVSPLDNASPITYTTIANSSWIQTVYGVAIQGSSVYLSGTRNGDGAIYALDSNNTKVATCVSGSCNVYGVADNNTYLAYVDQNSIYVNQVPNPSTPITVTEVPTGLAFNNNLLYVTRNLATATGTSGEVLNSTNAAIQKLDVANNSITNFAFSTLFNHPNAITVDPNTGKLYVANDGDKNILVVSADGTQVQVHLDASLHGGCQPRGLAVGAGHLYVGCQSGEILQVTL